jgi:hypothetical protein
MTRFLTKSRFKTALECPTKLSYTGNSAFSDARSGDAFMEALADGGFQIGELAKLMHPGGVEVRTADHAEALRQTNALLERDEVTIFEAAVCAGNLFVRIDVLRKSGNCLEVIEVKAKSYNAEEELTNSRGAIKAGFLPYLQDVAFQLFVVRSAFPNHEACSFLMLADKMARATVDQLSQKFKIARGSGGHTVEVAAGIDGTTIGAPLLKKIAVDELVQKILVEPVRFPGGELGFGEAITNFSDHYKYDRKLPPTLGAHCRKCEFRTPLPSAQSGFHNCWKAVTGWGDEDFEGGTVLDVWNLRGKDALIQAGIFTTRAVGQEHFKLSDGRGPLTHGDRQWMQVSGIWPGGGDYYLNHAGLRQVEATWTYPLHFIDFETSRPPIPFHRGRKPYDQVAFQFSHHVMHADGTVVHAGQFLEASPGVFPNYAFVRELRRQTCVDNGTILRWASHENSVLRDIWWQLEEDSDPPDDKTQLQAFISEITSDKSSTGSRTMVDLCKIAEKYYFHPATKGSCSIKKVLPAVFQSSKVLRDLYSNAGYGTSRGISSLNFTEWTWWRPGSKGDGPIDPYKLLPCVFAATEGLLPSNPDTDEELANGGAAMNAYARLQYEKLGAQERSHLEAALLKYCELDTLAMVMILQSWRNNRDA